MVNKRRIDRSAEVVKEEAKHHKHYINPFSTAKVMPAVLREDDEILFGEEAVQRASEALEKASESDDATYEDLVQAVIEALKNEDPPQDDES
jgi:hypothetical protein